MTLTVIEVTSYHISVGLRKSCSECPVAIAMSDAGLDCPEADCHRLEWWRDRTSRGRMKTPKAVRNFMNDFDWGRFVSPFTFELTDEREG
jgi:hypothetical protein